MRTNMFKCHYWPILAQYWNANIAQCTGIYQKLAKIETFKYSHIIHLIIGLWGQGIHFRHQNCVLTTMIGALYKGANWIFRCFRYDTFRYCASSKLKNVYDYAK